ncbi:MAG: plasmid maintenance system killer protein [Parvibaculum sp.]
MIQSYRNKLTEAVASGAVKKGFPRELVRRAQLMLTLLHHAKELNDLRSPPGNRLEKLSGDRTGQYSVRINQQWRIALSGEKPVRRMWK